VGGIVNLPAVLITAFVTTLLVIGTKESATFNAVLVCIKVAALTLFVVITVPMIFGHMQNFHPFTPRGWGNPLDSSGTGVLGAAASIFFAYVGFDAVSTAAEETKNPQRNVPIGLIGSLLICTVFYLLVAGGVIGSFGAQPLIDPATGKAFVEGSPELYGSAACSAAHAPLVCSKEALAYVLREVSSPWAGWLVGLAATIALPSVVLLMMYGQTRIFFVMARDGLLPQRLDRPPALQDAVGGDDRDRHRRRDLRRLPAGRHARGLFEFGHLVRLRGRVARRDDPAREGQEPGEAVPNAAIWVIAPLSILGCVVLFVSLNRASQMVFLVWAAIGLVFYFLYGYRMSHVGRGIVDVPEPEAYEDLEPPIPGTH
jgi:APA family basic amino acid/polyamine antiporter